MCATVEVHSQQFALGKLADIWRLDLSRRIYPSRSGKPLLTFSYMGIMVHEWRPKQSPGLLTRGVFRASEPDLDSRRRVKWFILGCKPRPSAQYQPFWRQPIKAAFFPVLPGPESRSDNATQAALWTPLGTRLFGLEDGAFSKNHDRCGVIFTKCVDVGCFSG
jgi:hypothetical protein